MRHEYINRQSRRRITLNGLCGALAQYYWKDKSYDENECDLRNLRSGLLRALEARTERRDECVRVSCDRVLQWGGVVAHNGNWLVAHQVGLAEKIRKFANTLRCGNDDLAIPFRDVRFNAGMTKIYSLLVPGFIIYDSRVAAALGWFIVRWCSEINAPTVPHLLAFSWMPAKEAPNCQTPKTRNPSCGRYNFPRLYHDPVKYARDNLRASWILFEIVNTSEKLCFHGKEDPLRALEAALFMWGYDLTDH